ncbi:hypothetical protein [Actinomadura alba]|uniref:hypothetical protein n=1 Tax=Actinomadura alba TaxID=406431 RepID=UPI0031D351EE
MFYSFVERAANLTSIPFALIGFGVTFWQLSKTKKAAESARDAAKIAQGEMSRASLLTLIPQLQRVEEELERAVRLNSSELVISWLANWRWQAGQVRGLLMVISPNDKKTLKAIQASVAAAALVKSSLIDDPDLDLSASTKPARDAMSIVTNEIGALATTHQIQTGGS